MAKRKLNKKSSHRKALFKNQLISLFKNEQIKTTLPKAKELRPIAEKMITKAKKNNINTRRQAMGKLNDKEAVEKLFDIIAPRYMERPGGYTRIIKLYPRRGDASEMALIKLVEEE